MKTVIRCDQLSEAIRKEVDDMNLNVIKQLNEIAEEVGKEAVQSLKQTSPVRTDGYKRKFSPGAYAKSWGYDVQKSGSRVNSVVVYNKKHGNITHLLEFGYVVPATGQRSVVHPHIASANKTFSEEFVKRAEEIKL